MIPQQIKASFVMKAHSKNQIAKFPVIYRECIDARDIVGRKQSMGIGMVWRQPPNKAVNVAHGVEVVSDMGGIRMAWWCRTRNGSSTAL